MSTTRFIVLALIFIVGSNATAADAPKSRTFLFTYGATITGLEPGKSARVWVPVAVTNEDQTVRIDRQSLPATPQETVEPKYGNHLLYFEAVAPADGKVPLSVVYRVTRREVGEDTKADADEAAQFLKADKLVPIGGKPSSLIDGRTLPDDDYQKARTLYDVVDDHMQYRKDKPGFGRGDAEWACDSKFGNCTDFHSLFISLARTNKLPAKFEIGFGINEQRGAGEVPGYHCWAKFLAQNHGWVPVDISEANKNPAKRAYFFGHLCENRVGFTTGRDLQLVPQQAGPPLNYLIYPYVEVDGQPYPAERIEKHYRYEDLP